MGKRTVVPFGPQHPVLPEPIHLDLVLEDEKVIEAIPSIGYIHRGLEKLIEKRDFNDYLYVIERICGICSYMLGMGYCESLGKIFVLRYLTVLSIFVLYGVRCLVYTVICYGLDFSLMHLDLKLCFISVGE